MNRTRKNSWMVRFILLLAVLLAACGSFGEAVQPVETALIAPTATQPAPAATEVSLPPTLEPVIPTRPVPVATPTLVPGTFTNPVFDRDFPDPDVLQAGGSYYAYATNSSSMNIQVARSDDLVTWRLIKDALPVLPQWAVKSFGWVWAPEVTTDARGENYLMYFTARYAIGSDGAQCIGVAIAGQPEGPFRSRAEKPLICQLGQGGSIDAASFVDDDGARYLLWKNDGNAGGGQSWLYIQRVSDNGLSLLGEPTRLITADQAWEGILVEAPTLWKQAGKYYLFYSANDYTSPRYAIGYAVATNVLGPYEKPAQALLSTNLSAGVVGPGGQDIIQAPDDRTWILFHSWTSGGYRNLHLAPLAWDNGIPGVANLSKEPLEVPVLTGD